MPPAVKASRPVVFCALPRCSPCIGATPACLQVKAAPPPPPSLCSPWRSHHLGLLPAHARLRSQEDILKLRVPPWPQAEPGANSCRLAWSSSCRVLPCSRVSSHRMPCPSSSARSAPAPGASSRGPPPGAPNHLPERSSRVLPVRKGLPSLAPPPASPRPLLGALHNLLWLVCLLNSALPPLHDGLPALLQPRWTGRTVTAGKGPVPSVTASPGPSASPTSEIEISSQPRTYIFITCDLRIFSGLPW